MKLQAGALSMADVCLQVFAHSVAYENVHEWMSHVTPALLLYHSLSFLPLNNIQPYSSMISLTKDPCIAGSTGM